MSWTRAYSKALAPATISVISCVIAACLARLYRIVKSLMTFLALSVAVLHGRHTSSIFSCLGIHNNTVNHTFCKLRQQLIQNFFSAGFQFKVKLVLSICFNGDPSQQSEAFVPHAFDLSVYSRGGCSKHRAHQKFILVHFNGFEIILRTSSKLGWLPSHQFIKWLNTTSFKEVCSPYHRYRSLQNLYRLDGILLSIP